MYLFLLARSARSRGVSLFARAKREQKGTLCCVGRRPTVQLVSINLYNNLQYTEDNDLSSESPEDLQAIISAVNGTSWELEYRYP